MNAEKILYAVRLVILLNWFASGSIMHPKHVDLDKFASWRQARMNERAFFQESDRYKTHILPPDPPVKATAFGHMATQHETKPTGR